MVKLSICIQFNPPSDCYCTNSKFCNLCYVNIITVMLFVIRKFVNYFLNGLSKESNKMINHPKYYIRIGRLLFQGFACFNLLSR